MPSILIFESDPTFAHEIQGALLARHCSVSIVDDAALGLEKATSAPPDLILLCAELPRMNGFSVCNRLRGNPALQRVPVIIMSANSSEDTFQQHRNLAKKRADDYVHKPLSVATLLEHVERLLPLSNGNLQSESATNDGGFDDIEELEADDLLTEDAVAVPEPQSRGWSNDVGLTSAIGVSTDDLDAFAENAFGSLLADNHQRPANESTVTDSIPPAAASLPPPSAPPPSFSNGSQSSPPDAFAVAGSLPPPARVPSEMPGIAFAGTSRSSVPPASRNEDLQTLVALQLELADAKESINDLEEALSASKERDQKLEALYAELDDARARLASGGGGRAKDVLDLREQLNAKEKSLLDLRDQLTRKEKELLATKDNALELERRTADAQERAVDLEKRLHASERSEHAAIQDRDQAAKRAETHRRKAEKLAEEQAALRGEFDALRAEVDAQRVLQSQTAADLDATRGELNQVQATLTVTQANLEARQSQLQATEGNLAAVTLERDQAVATLAEVQTQLDDATQQIEALEQRQRQALAQLNDTSAVLEQTRVTVNDLTRDLGLKSQEVETLTEGLNETQRALSDMTGQCDRALGRSRDLDAALSARTTEFTELDERHQAASQRLSKAEEQLDQSQLQAAELAEHVARHRVAAGEIGGLLSDALSKLREIQPA